MKLRHPSRKSNSFLRGGYNPGWHRQFRDHMFTTCLLYTSDAADERSSVDLGGRRIIKKKIF